MKQMICTISGMHCASCESIIEKRLKASAKFTAIEVSLAKGSVTLSFEGECPSCDELDRMFPEGHYTFSKETPPMKNRVKEPLIALSLSAGVLALFFGLSASYLLPPVTIDQTSSYGAFLLFGLVAGLSTCAALVGGLVLTLSSRWITRYSATISLSDKLRPHLSFNAGRITAYTLFGALLGLFGESVQLSPLLTSGMVIAVSSVMIIVALQMLGFTPFNRIRLALPKALLPAAAGKELRGGRLHPFSSGFMTILLPCGFTMIAESAALISGNPLHGMLIMLFFVLGTTPALLAIGLSATGFASRPSTSRLFLKTAGILVIFFSVYNLNSQFGIAGLLFGERTAVPSPAMTTGQKNESTGATATTGATQLIRTTYTNKNDIAQTMFDVRKGEKVRFVVDPKETGTGCMSTIMVPGLWDRPEPLVKGKSIVMEFTPVKAGQYRITCAMGVPRGVITVR